MMSVWSGNVKYRYLFALLLLCLLVTPDVSQNCLIFHVFYRCGRGRVGRIKNYHPRQYVTVITKHDTLCLNRNSIVKESVGYGINLKWSLLVNAKYVQINCENLAYLSLLRNAMLCHNLCYYPITFLYSAGLSLLGNWLN